MAAREARHAFLSRAAGEAGVRTIALAHQADDQVELFLLRLLRGAGVQGLAGMRWSGPSPADPRYRLIRPLLGCNRSELETFARLHRIRWRVDASNSCTDMLRNRVRHELLPLLERRYQPGFRSVVRREMELLAGTAGLLGQLSRDWREHRREPWGDLAVALKRQVLCDELLELGVEPDFDLVEQLRLRPGCPICILPDVTVCVMADGRVIKARPASRHDRAFASGEIRVPLSGLAGKGAFDGLGWRWKIHRSSIKPRFGPGREWFDADKVGPEVVLRHWHPGDRFRPSGMLRLVKLQDLFTNLKIPPAARRKLIVATTAAGQLWWVEGVRIAEDFKLRPDTVRRFGWFWKREQPLAEGSSEA
jgi:tRNA(Ile)-lysidine synthase